MSKRKYIARLVDGGFIAREGARVLILPCAGAPCVVLEGSALEYALMACLEAKGVQLGETYTINFKDGQKPEATP